MSYQLHQGDCLETLRGMADNSVDSIVTDPPYGLSFMGKKWDYDVPKVEVWEECLRVLKPGGHLLAFAGTRTQHRMAVRIEDAGFEIRDMIAWVYGSGFPKSLDVSKAIDKAAGAEREVIGENPNHRAVSGVGYESVYQGGNTGAAAITAPATEAARQWQGWGTALKPAMEMITMARKPLAGTVAANVLQHGTGALNIDGCRVSASDKAWGSGNRDSWRESEGRSDRQSERYGEADKNPRYRWPANLIHDGSPEVLAGFPDTGLSSGGLTPGVGSKTNPACWAFGDRLGAGAGGYGDTGSAARFFYTAKASQEDRDAGLHGFGLQEAGIKNDSGRGFSESDPMRKIMRANSHPTVKPTDLMRYLVRLVTPPGGTVLDPFNGSGSTGKACMLEGFDYIGCELDPAYIEISRARIEHAIALRASGAEKLHPASERDDKTIDLFSGANE